MTNSWSHKYDTMYEQMSLPADWVCRIDEFIMTTQST